MALLDCMEANVCIYSSSARPPARPLPPSHRPTVADRESGVAGADLLREMGGGRMQLEGRRMYAAAIA